MFPLRVGDLLTDTLFYTDVDVSKVRARLFTVEDMYRLALGRVLEDPEYVLDVVQSCVNVDIHHLTDNDLLYIMAWLRLHSYPKAPVMVEWRCYNNIEWEGKIQPCNRLNTQTVYNPKLSIKTLESYKSIEGLTLPTVNTYLEWYRSDKELSLMYENARYIKEGNTLKDKLQILEKSDLGILKQILDFKDKNNYGLKESLELKCLQCGYETTYTVEPNILSFFPDHTEESILNMQYSLMQAFGVLPDNTMPSKQLLYMYSHYVKDRQELEQLEKAKAANRKGGNYRFLGE